MQSRLLGLVIASVLFNCSAGVRATDAAQTQVSTRQNDKIWRKRIDPAAAVRLKSGNNVELEEGHGGTLACVLRVTLEEGNPWVSKTAEYRFDLAGDGRAHEFDFGPKVPIQSTVNNVISVEFINSGTTVRAKARFVAGEPTAPTLLAAWFSLEIEYARILERLATFANLLAVPYRETNQVKTDVVLRSEDEQELYTYDDEVIGRKLRITLRWTVGETPDKAALLKAGASEKLRCTLLMTDAQRKIRQTYLLTTPSPYRGQVSGSSELGRFNSGVQIPVETEINNTKSIQYIGLGVGAELSPLRPLPHASGLVSAFDIPLRVHYQRLRERAFVAKAEIPYSEDIDFEAQPRLDEGQGKSIFQSDDAIRGKSFNATISWHRETP
jgi:hypothetical protein